MTAEKSTGYSNDLTTPIYWSQRQMGINLLEQDSLRDSTFEWFPRVERFLREYEGQRFLEIGCSPGHVAAFIASRIRFQMEGVDFSSEAFQFLQNLQAVGVADARLHGCDVREYNPESLYSVVASFGLVEHFDDSMQILFQHHRLVANGGLCVVVIPNFRKVQWLYHRLFDYEDLKHHNLSCMTLTTFEDFAYQYQYEILYLGYTGRMRFWNSSYRGSTLARFVYRASTKSIRTASYWAGRWLPEDHEFLSPWIVFVGRKKDR